MTDLECTAKSCVYNENCRCSKDYIKVEGKEAREACETCCGSFREKND